MIAALSGDLVVDCHYSDRFARFEVFRVSLRSRSRLQAAKHRDNMPIPEELARQHIDKRFTACRWTIQEMSWLNPYASLDVAVPGAMGKRESEEL